MTAGRALRCLIGAALLGAWAAAAMGAEARAESRAEPGAEPGAAIIDRIDLPRATPDGTPIGGFSGLDLTPDGNRLILLSDKGFMIGADIRRTDAGDIAALTLDARPTPLRNRAGQPLAPPWSDSEGLRILPSGLLAVSFEGLHRIAIFTSGGEIVATLPVPRPFADLAPNDSLEALALAPDGAFLTFPEGPIAGSPRIPAFRYDGKGWTQPFTLPGERSFRPVDAAFGPDGRLYVLERDFWPLMGFQTRLRRVTFGENGPTREETLWRTRAGTEPNNEGLALWQGPDGLRALIVSDDNMLGAQDSRLTELRLPD